MSLLISVPAVGLVPTDMAVVTKRISLQTRVFQV